MLTERDESILETLSLKVRLLTIEQIAATWWKPTSTGQADARRRLRQLRERGYVEAWKVKARPLLDLAHPVVVWSPGEPAPNAGKLSYELKKRWTEPAKTTTVVIAAKRSLHHYGASGRRLNRPLQATHDLHISSIFLKVLSRTPELAMMWVGEDAIQRVHGVKHPDAILVDTQGLTKLVIEFGGEYSAERVKKFHYHCAEQALPYHLW